VRRVFDGGEPLDGPWIRQAEGTDVAVGPGLLRGPLDGVEAVATFGLVGGELSIGSVTSSDILENDGVTPGYGLFKRFVASQGRFR